MGSDMNKISSGIDDKIMVEDNHQQKNNRKLEVKRPFTTRFKPSLLEDLRALQNEVSSDYAYISMNVLVNLAVAKLVAMPVDDVRGELVRAGRL